MGQTASIGKCNYCGQAFSKSGMTRHLATCKARKTAIEQEDSATKGKPQPIFHLAIGDKFSSAYWLHLEVVGRAQLSDLDQFLRDIWVECCGHLSMFVVGSQHYASIPMDHFDDIVMDARLKEAFKAGQSFRYEYDFGSTTELDGKVIDMREGVWTQRDPVRIMARNDPPKILCDECGQREATQVCTYCYPDSVWYCDDCAGKLDEETVDMLLPVVNSPRVGVCGYTGEPAM